ncbi:MAG: hypothetical protein V1728_04925 [Candidatus Micrarchaeota archaeon]
MKFIGQEEVKRPAGGKPCLKEGDFIGEMDSKSEARGGMRDDADKRKDGPEQP